jgi:hypothetical protein
MSACSGNSFPCSEDSWTFTIPVNSISNGDINTVPPKSRTVVNPAKELFHNELLEMQRQPHFQIF